MRIMFSVGYIYRTASANIHLIWIQTMSLYYNFVYFIIMKLIQKEFERQQSTRDCISKKKKIERFLCASKLRVWLRRVHKKEPHKGRARHKSVTN